MLHETKSFAWLVSAILAVERMGAVVARDCIVEVHPANKCQSRPRYVSEDQMVLQVQLETWVMGSSEVHWTAVALVHAWGAASISRKRVSAERQWQRSCHGVLEKDKLWQVLRVAVVGAARSDAVVVEAAAAMGSVAEFSFETVVQPSLWWLQQLTLSPARQAVFASALRLALILSPGKLALVMSHTPASRNCPRNSAGLLAMAKLLPAQAVHNLLHQAPVAMLPQVWFCLLSLPCFAACSRGEMNVRRLVELVTLSAPGRVSHWS
jgi:hypothetical protein